MAKVKFDLEVVNFKQEIKRIEKEIEQYVDLDVFARMTYATQQLAQVTPVDTGEARSGWKSKIVESPRIGGIQTEGFIINEVDHIEALNDGHSKQAPKFFIEQVLMTIGLLTPEL